MDIEQLYFTNEIVKDYIDKYSSKHNISITEAFKHKQTELYISYLVEKNLL